MIGFGICDKCKRYGTVKENIVVNGNEIRVFLLCNECEEEKRVVLNMKAYRVYLQDMWIEYGIEYALSYDTALRIFNNKLRELMKDTKDDWCDKVDFGEEVLSFRDQLKWHEDIEIVFRKNPIIMYKDGQGLKADVYHLEEPNYEYGDSDIKNQTIVLEEIIINE